MPLIAAKRSGAVRVADSRDWVYEPPSAAHTAQRILVKPNLGYPVGPPATVSMGVLGTVLKGLRQANPGAEILIVEGVCSPVGLLDIAAKHGLYALLDEGMRLLDADELPLQEYPNLSPQPARFKTMWVPKLLEEVDCRISVGALKQTQLKGEPLISACLKNLYGLLPRSRYKARSPHSRGQLHRPSVPQVLQDVYFTFGHWFDGGVVDADQKYFSADWKPDKGRAIALHKVFFGDDLIAVDRTACQVGEEPLPTYLDAIDRLRASQP